MHEQPTNDIQLLEQYLAGQLSTSEKKSVEKRLRSDKDFIMLYEIFQRLPEAARRLHLERKLKELRKLEEDVQDETSRPPVPEDSNEERKT